MRKSKGIAILFVIYLLFLIWLIVFKLNFSISSIHSVRDINLIPFHYEDVEPGDVPILEALMNLAVFIPFGFLLSKTFEKMKYGTKALVVVLLSLFFETTQYVLSIGASDITDIITNTIGGVIGLLLAHMTSFSKTKTK